MYRRASRCGQQNCLRVVGRGPIFICSSKFKRIISAVHRSYSIRTTLFRCLLESLFTNSSMLVGYSATASFQTGAGSFHAPNIFRLFLMLAGSKYYKSTVFFLRRWMLTRTSTVCQYPNSFSLLIGYIFWPLGQCLLILFSLVIPCHCIILRHLASIRRSLVQHLIYLVT